MRGFIAFTRGLRDALFIRRSGLLHERYYRSQFYKELKSDRYLLRLSPVLHYVFFGATQNKNPNEFFDTEYYHDRLGETLGPVRNPLAHFLRTGAEAGLNPGPYFDTAFYRRAHPEARATDLNPLQHFLLHGRDAGLAPHPATDAMKTIPAPAPGSTDEGRAWLQEGLGPPPRKTAKTIPREGRFIRFDWDPGGWNNIRMQVEVLACLARRYGRALVLPAADRWYLTPGDRTHLFDFFDEVTFRAVVPVLPAETRSVDEWEVPARLAAINTVRLDRDAFDSRQQRQSWYFPRTTRMFGCAATILGSNAEDYALLYRAFRLRPDLLDSASRLLERNGLQPGGYLAVHVRRGDFEQRDRFLPIEKIVQALAHHGADWAGKLLIVSDQRDEPLMDACRARGWQTVCWAGDPAVDDKHAGVLDMLCCCLGWRFVGTRLSTFSNGIMQWRGYVSRAAPAHIDAVPRFTAGLDQVPWWGAVDPHAWLSV